MNIELVIDAQYKMRLSIKLLTKIGIGHAIPFPTYPIPIPIIFSMKAL